MNPSLTFLEEHQEKKTVMKTGIWITEKAIIRFMIHLITKNI